MVILTERFEQALLYAHRLHIRQSRKGTQIPYISHLLAVAALVLEDGGDEDEAIAALLHDAVEDQGGYATLDEIRLRFGERVASIVDAVSDAYILPKPPWKERKQAYLNALPVESPEALRVSLADKIHNARSTLHDLRIAGDDIWKRFNGGKEGTLWYYRELVRIFQEQRPSPLVDDLARIVGEIGWLAERSSEG